MVRDKSFYTTLLKLSVPVALQGLAMQLVGTADNVMVSSLGDAALSGVAVSNSMTNLLNMLLLGLASGSAVLVSQYWGKQDKQRIASVFSVVLQGCLGAALIGATLFFLFPRQAMRLMSDYDDIIAYGAIYLRTVAFSFVFSALTAALASMLRCVELVSTTLYAALISLALNVALNYVLIFGKLGLPALGVQGAAVATLISRGVECCIMWVYAFFVQKRIPLRMGSLLHFDGMMWKDYLRFGVPVALGDSQWALVGVCKASIIGHLGPMMTAANSVAESMLGLIMIFSNSLTNGACVLIGKSVGEKDYAKTRAYSNTIQILFAGVGVVMCGVVFLLRSTFVGLYVDLTPQTQQLAMQFIGIGALTMLGTSYHAACFMGINRGAGDAQFVFKVDMICGWLIVLPLSYLAAFVWKLPLPIVFLFIRIDQLFKWIIAFIRLRGNKWIKNVTRE